MKASQHLTQFLRMNRKVGRARSDAPDPRALLWQSNPSISAAAKYLLP
jgi:hypothetical protein